MINEKLIKPKEVMNRIGISYSTLLRQTKKGSIPHVKIGRQYRYPESFFDDLISKANHERMEVEG